MSVKKASLEEFISAGTEKTASGDAVPNNTKSSVLSKLSSYAEEIENLESKESAESGKPGEGTVAKNNEVVAEPSAEVTQQTDAVINEQLEVDAPGAVQEQAKGDTPVPVSAVTPVISKGMGETTTAKDLDSAPESLEAAKKPTDKTAGENANLGDPKIWAKTAAAEFHNELKKIAVAEEAVEAAKFLKMAGHLDKYNLTDLVEKTASADQEAASIFAKMREGEEELSNSDLIKAASAYSAELEKEAEAEVQANLEKEAAAKQEQEINETVEKFAGNKDVLDAVSLLTSVGLLSKEM